MISLQSLKLDMSKMQVFASSCYAKAHSQTVDLEWNNHGGNPVPVCTNSWTKMTMKIKCNTNITLGLDSVNQIFFWFVLIW